MYDAELDTLRQQVRKAASGASPMTKHETYVAMKRIAERLAHDGESVEKSFVRNFTGRNSPGVEIFKYYSARPGTSTIAKAVAPQRQDSDLPSGDVAGDESGAQSFSDLVDQYSAAHGDLSRSACIDRVMGSNEGRRAYSIEKRRTLGGGR